METTVLLLQFSILVLIGLFLIDGKYSLKWYLSSCHKVVSALSQDGGKHLGRVETKQQGPFMTSPLPIYPDIWSDYPANVHYNACL